MKGSLARGQLGMMLASGILALVFVCVMALPVSGLTLPAGSNPFKTQAAGTVVQYYVPYYDYGRRPRYQQRYRPQTRQKKKRTYRRKRVTKPKCAHPWTYSQGLRKCICVLEGYGLSGGKCLKYADLCAETGRWSQADKQCLCSSGYVLKGGRCVSPQLARVPDLGLPGAQCLWPKVLDAKKKVCGCAPGYREEGDACLSATKRDNASAAKPNRGDGILTTEVALIQQCLKEAGYLRGDIATRMTKRAWSAFWYFKQDYKVGSTPKGVHEAKAQGKLFDLCPLAARAVNDVLTASLDPSENLASAATEEAAGQDDAPASPVKKVYAKPEANCLPDNLYGLVIKAYGRRTGLKQCSQTCVAIPKWLSNQKIARNGVIWREMVPLLS